MKKLGTMKVLNTITSDLVGLVNVHPLYKGLIEQDDLEQEICCIVLEYMAVNDVTADTLTMVREYTWKKLSSRLETEFLRRSRRAAHTVIAGPVLEDPESAFIRAMNTRQFRSNMYESTHMKPAEKIVVECLCGFDDGLAISPFDVVEFLADTLQIPSDEASIIAQNAADKLRSYFNLRYIVKR